MMRDFDIYENGPLINIAEWTPAGKDAPTQVHIILHTSVGDIVTRLKSAAVTDEIIDALVKHREGVWGKRG
jgi:hypothetical protein